MTFGQSLAKYRKGKVLTQRNVAEAINVPLHVIIELERDAVDPNQFSHLEELSMLVGAPLQELRALAQNYSEHSALRRKVEADEEFSMLAFRRSQE